jgi:hypothetical protein
MKLREVRRRVNLKVKHEKQNQLEDKRRVFKRDKSRADARRVEREYNTSAKSKKRTILSDHELFEDRSGHIKNFVLAHANGRNFEERLLSLAVTISRLPRVEVDYLTITKKWGNRSAEEILSEGTTFALKDSSRVGRDIQGCMDTTTAFVAAARILAKIEKIPAKVYFVRWGNHSTARVEYNKKSLRLDPYDGTRYPGDSRAKYSIHRKMARIDPYYAEGGGPREIGLYTIHDFEKYGPKGKIKLVRKN